MKKISTEDTIVDGIEQVSIKRIYLTGNSDERSLAEDTDAHTAGESVKLRTQNLHFREKTTKLKISSNYQHHSLTIA